MILKDKIILVTGGSGLIGREIVSDIRRQGGIAINADINVDTCLEKGTYHLDISDDLSIHSLVSMVKETFGRIDGLVNSAYPRTPDWGAFFENIAPASWRKNVDLQMNSCFVICQSVLSVMSGQGYGSIVNIASIYGVVGNDFTLYEEYGGTSPAAYCAIKGGIINFSRYLASYYGKKDKEQKAAIVQEFKEGEKRMIVATKAFGMGVDISDIDRVYHVAPSSTFVDYIQEIGRAARDMDIHGVSATDYHERDFYYMKRLHMAGNIAQEQLSLILKKLMEVYRMKGGKREMLVSLSDFEFVVKLPRMKNKLEYEAELGQLIKTALLWLEDDLSHRYGKKLLEVSPQNLLTEGYIQDKTGDTFIREFSAYLTKVPGTEDVYTARLEKLWEERFAELGYREFKQKLNGGTLWEGSRAVSVGKHEVLLKEDAAVIRQRMDALFNSLKTLLVDKLRKTKGRFDEEELRAVFAEHDMDVPSAKRFIGSLLESRTEEGRSVSYISSVKKKDSNELSFTVTKGFDLLLSRYQKLFGQRIVGEKGDRLLFYTTPFSDLNMLLNLLSMLDCLSFSVEGGGTPCVSLTFDEPETLERIASSDEYHNLILENNEKIFQEQIDLFSFFFGTDGMDDTKRWNFIEDYFTGMGVEELKVKYATPS